MSKDCEIIAGIDVGTTKVVVGIAEVREGEVIVTGVGAQPCRGLPSGIVTNIEEASKAIEEAVQEAYRQSGTEISYVYVSVSGQTMSKCSTGMVTVKGQEVRRVDIERVLEAARSTVLPPDQKVIHILPQQYTVNGQDGIKNPVGMCGVRLETKAHLVTASESNLQNLSKCVKRSGLEVEAFVLDHYAAALATLQNDEKELGVAYIDVGGGITNIIIYIDESVVFTSSIPIGGNHITKDIAIGLSTPLSSAEDLKKKYGYAIIDEVVEEEEIKIPMVGGRPERKISKKGLSRFIQPRVEQIIDLIYKVLEKSTFVSALASGIVLGGGASLLPGFVDLAESIMELPVRRAEPFGVGGIVEIMKGKPQFATIVGLLRFAAEESAIYYNVPEGGEREAVEREKSVWKTFGQWLKEII